MFDGKVVDPETPTSFITESMIFGISGLILGAFIDKQFKKLTKKNEKYKLLISMIQLFVLVLIINVIYKVLKYDFALHFQQTLPGMAFPALYFGVQSNIFETAQSYI